MDPAALIAAALKRKFANCNGETKSVDWAEKENNFRSRLDDKSSPVKVRRKRVIAGSLDL